MRKKCSLTLLFGTIPWLFGCRASPSQDILGSYFPSWMLCVVIGIMLTVIVHVGFVNIGIDEFIPVKLLVYLGLLFSFTFFTWLIWFGN